MNLNKIIEAFNKEKKLTSFSKKQKNAIFEYLVNEFKSSNARNVNLLIMTLESRELPFSYLVDILNYAKKRKNVYNSFVSNKSLISSISDYISDYENNDYKINYNNLYLFLNFLNTKKNVFNFSKEFLVEFVETILKNAKLEIDYISSILKMSRKLKLNLNSEFFKNKIINGDVNKKIKTPNLSIAYKSKLDFDFNVITEVIKKTLTDSKSTSENIAQTLNILQKYLIKRKIADKQKTIAKIGFENIILSANKVLENEASLKDITLTMNAIQRLDLCRSVNINAFIVAAKTVLMDEKSIPQNISLVLNALQRAEISYEGSLKEKIGYNTIFNAAKMVFFDWRTKSQEASLTLYSCFKLKIFIEPKIIFNVSKWILNNSQVKKSSIIITLKCLEKSVKNNVLDLKTAQSIIKNNRKCLEKLKESEINEIKTIFEYLELDLNKFFKFGEEKYNEISVPIVGTKSVSKENESQNNINVDGTFKEKIYNKKRLLPAEIYL